MENPQFDLQQAINNYVQCIYRQGCLTSSDVKELEAHLLDATETLIQSGLSEEEAFLVARKRTGQEELLTAEYAKVNPIIKTDKSWAYLFTGFNLIYGFFGLLTATNILVYDILKKIGHNSANLPVVFYHLLLCGLFVLLSIKKKTISAFLSQAIERYPLRTTLITCLLPILVKASHVMTIRYSSLSSMSVPLYTFQGDHLVEFSFYMVLFSFFICLLSLISSIQHPQKTTLRALFEKPSVLFLIIFGFGTECFAASARSLANQSLAIPVVLFALVYMIGSLLISYCNPKVKFYLFYFAMVGFALELGAGIASDIDRASQNTSQYVTPYFVPALVLGVVMGFYLGNFLREKTNALAAS